MLDLCRLIFGMVIDLLRSRVALETEILILRQQINVLGANPSDVGCLHGIAAMDLFVVPTIFFRPVYGLLIMGHGRRQILWFGVTAHPTAEWIAYHLTEACGWEQIPRYLILDRDGAYGEIFMRRVRAFGIRDRPTSPRSPWQNADAERLIGSIRRECIDHIVVFGERHLRHVLLSYMSYYNGTRTHLSLNKDASMSRAAERSQAAECLHDLTELIHVPEREAS